MGINDDSLTGGLVITVPPQADDEWIQRELSHARRAIGDKLMDSIKYSRWYAVRVDEVPPHPAELEYYMGGGPDYGMFDPPEWRLKLSIRPVQHEHIVMTEGPDYSAMPLAELSFSAIGEIKRRIRLRLKR